MIAQYIIWAYITITVILFAHRTHSLTNVFFSECRMYDIFISMLLMISKKYTDKSDKHFLLDDKYHAFKILKYFDNFQYDIIFSKIFRMYVKREYHITRLHNIRHPNLTTY